MYVSERIAAITKENTKLFKRIEGAKASIDNNHNQMMKSMQHSTSKEALQKSGRNAPGGNSALATKNSHSKPKPIKLESLNHNVRMREQERIEQANAENMKWLQAVKPSIDVRK